MNRIRRLKVLALSVLLLLASWPVLAVDSGYQIGPGDVLRISVYDHADLTTQARVDDKGNITIPLAGQVEIEGQTASEAAQLIATKLNGDYIINPQVSVFIEEFRSKKVVVFGEIMRPGVYELNGPTTLLELVSKAGGLSKLAGQSATIHRVGEKEHTFKVNIGELLDTKGRTSEVQLMDGDTVTIAKAGVVYITGQVNRPAAYSLEPDMTVIKAVTLAGGFTPLASEGRIRIIRKIGGSEQVFEKVSLHDKLAPDDVMVVPESFF